MRGTFCRCLSLARAAQSAAAPQVLHHHRHHQHPLRLLQCKTLPTLRSSQPPPPSFSILTPRFSRTRAVQRQVTRCLSQHGENLTDGEEGNYFDPPFWDSTYAKEPQPLEWYQSYSELSPLLKKYIPIHSRVLMSGCGNSELAEDMVKDGYNEIVNIDISPVVIETMKKKYQNVSQLKYMTMDVLDLSYFDNGFFDAVIDKGTLDAIMCVAGGPYNIAMMLAEITRTLKSGGLYMLVSFAGPHLSLPLLNRDAFGWSIDSYTMSKQGPSEDCKKAYSEPVLLDSDGVHAYNQTVEGSDSLYIYMCTKVR